MDLPPLPPGFTLDQQNAVPPLPPGFTLDKPQRFGSGKSFDVNAEGGLTPTAEMVNTPSRGITDLGEWLHAARRVGEAGAHYVTGIPSYAAGQLAGLGALGYDITANAVMHPFSGSTPGAYADPAAVSEKVSNALTYQPSESDTVSNAIVNAPGKMIGGSSDYLREKVTNIGGEGAHPYLGDVAGGIPVALANYLGYKSAKLGVQNAEKPVVPNAAKPEISPRQALIDELNAKGLKVTPTQAGAKVGGLVEGLSGPAKMERGISMRNAPKVNELIGEDVGLKGSKNITEADITRLKVEANKPYNEISKTGSRRVSNEYRQEIASIGERTGGESFKAMVPKDIKTLKTMYGKIERFDANDAVNQIRQLRSEASKNIKAINAPEQNAKGYVQKAIAEALDNELQRHVEAIGKPDLVAKYKAARIQLAKLNTLQDALEGSNVSAASLASAKERGVPLTGNMDLVARAYGEFDRAFQDVGKIRDSNPFNAVDLGAGVVGAAANPALLTAVLARPVARAALASNRYQRSLVSGKKSTAKAAPPKTKPVVIPQPEQKRKSG